MYVNNDGDNDDDDNDDNDDCGALSAHHTLLRAASAIHARCRFSSIGLLGKLEVFLTQRIRFLENIALALTLPG